MGDLIRRADIEYHTQLEARGNGQYEEVEVAYKSDIDNLPPVTPTERTGKWAVAYLDHESIGVRPKTLYCSECNWLTSVPSAWCPNCGAKMNGGDTE